MKAIFFDAEGCVAGRLAALAAKELLKGNSVNIVNAERALISGDPIYNIGLWKEKVEKGHPYAGPFYPKQPDRILKRIVRGMLPYKKPRGKAAFKRLRVYISIPSGLPETPVKPAQAVSKLKKSVSIGDISIKLGAKKVW